MPSAIPGSPIGIPAGRTLTPHYRAIRREHTLRSLQLASDLGAPHITTEPGGFLAPEQTPEAATDIFYEELMPCVELAEQLEVGLLIEPEPELLIERFDQYLAFAERVDSPVVGLNFDIGHAFCVNEDPQNWVATMSAHTMHYHLEDIAETRIHAHLIPGRGAIDFAATLQAISETGYQGWLTVELYPYIDSPDAAAREAREYLLQALASLGLAEPASP